MRLRISYDYDFYFLGSEFGRSDWKGPPVYTNANRLDGSLGPTFLKIA